MAVDSQKLKAIVKALDAWLKDPTKATALVGYNFNSNINPWSEATGSPYMTYVWEGGTITEDEQVHARLSILIMQSAEAQEGAMHGLTDFVEALINTLFDIDSVNLRARDENDKPVRVMELRPIEFIIEPSITERYRAHVGYVRCIIHFMR